MVHSFYKVMDYIDLLKYFVEKGYKIGRPNFIVQYRCRYDKIQLYKKNYICRDNKNSVKEKHMSSSKEDKIIHIYQREIEITDYNRKCTYLMHENGR